MVNHAKDFGIYFTDNESLKGFRRMGQAVWYLCTFAQITSSTSLFLTWIGITSGACALVETGSKIVSSQVF